MEAAKTSILVCAQPSEGHVSPLSIIAKDLQNRGYQVSLPNRHLLPSKDREHSVAIYPPNWKRGRQARRDLQVYHFWFRNAEITTWFRTNILQARAFIL